MTDVATADQLQHLCDIYLSEQHTVRRQLDEIERLLRQTQNDADKLAQREMNVNNQVRHQQKNYESISNDDISNIITMVSDI